MAVQVVTVYAPQPVQTVSTTAPQPIQVVSQESSFAYSLELLAKDSSTGLIYGGELGIGSNPAQFTIAAGAGLVVDHSTTPGTTVVYDVRWDAMAVDAEIGTGSRHPVYIAIDRDGLVHQETEPYDVEDYKTFVILGIVGVNPDTNAVVSTYQFGDVACNTHVRLRQFMESIGAFNISGNVISAHGADLMLSRSSGIVFRKAANHSVNPCVPDRQTTEAASIETFFRVYHTGGAWAYSSSPVDTIDPNYYDNGTNLVAVPANLPWTIQPFFYSKDARFIQYGQACYAKAEDAIAALSTAIQVHPILTTADFLVRAYIIVKRGCTALNDPATALIREAGRFGAGTNVLGAGEANTGSNANTAGIGVFLDKSLADLRFKGIKSADSYITVTESESDHTIAIGIDISALRTALGL